VKDPVFDCVHSVAEWLEAERNRYARAASTAGILGQIPIETTVVNNVTEGGYESTSEMRLVNPYNADETLWTIIRAAGDSDASRPIAERLHAAFGRSAHVSNTLYPTLFETDPADWIAKVWLPPLRSRYLQSLAALDQPDPVALRDIVDEFIEALQAETITTATIMPVAGLRVGGTLRTGALTLRPMTNEEFAELISPRSLPRGPLTMRRMQFAHVSERAILEARDSRPKTDATAQFTLLKRIVLSLQLLGFEPHGSGDSTTVYEPVRISGMIGSPVVLPEQGTWREVSPDNLREALDLAGRIPREVFEGSQQRVHIALARFQTAAAERFPADALIDFVIALEAVLLSAAEAELRFRFSLHGAYYLGRGPRDRAELFGEFQSIYDARSSIVHGSTLEAARLASARVTARRLASAVLTKGLRAGWPEPADLRRAIFG
jgi:hypothetical protein